MAPPTRNRNAESAFMTSKSDLRKKLRLCRQDYVKQTNNSSIDPELIHAARLCEAISGAAMVACYHDVRGEPNILGFALFAKHAAVQTALPWLPPMLDKASARAAHIIFRQWSPGDDIVQTALGFSQPSDRAATVQPDLILTPLLGFDRSLTRLGQGAGHYDRAFAAWPNALRIGIAWSVQEVGHVPTDPWDVPLDAILTEREWMTGPESRIAS
jgi:5-formyltetrahydrofolate cyclo-ligase